MRILFNDILQYSNAPDNLISPSLAERWIGNNLSIVLDKTRLINCVGIGNTDATLIYIYTDSSGSVLPGVLSENANELYSGLLAEVASPNSSALLTQIAVQEGAINYRQQTGPFNNNGLYMIDEQNISSLVIAHNGTYIGRLALGYSPYLGAAPSREPGFYSTNKSRETLSGQVIPGLGGYSGREIQVDFRYKITESVYRDIEEAYSTQLSRSYPLFMYFDKETHRMPYERLYGKTDTNLLFQSSVNRFEYSRKFKFREAF